ncbi:MAG TPA: hypothetical protein VD968_02400 [Pyrinomonadaceae bacterium]|nr:hypothetical protein [Pyrinomonadaceae bacterium]
MATEAQVTPFFYAQLNNDARDETVAAGANWRSHPLSFFYSSEVSVDIAVKRVMLQMLALEHATLPDFLWVNLRNMVNRATSAGDAVTIIAQVSSGAVHEPIG